MLNHQIDRHTADFIICVKSSLDCVPCHCPQLYDQVLSADISLHNTGKVDLDFTAIAVSGEKDLKPGEISVQPDNVTLINTILIFELASDLMILVNCCVWSNY